MIFLIQYDRKSGKLIRMEEYSAEQRPQAEKERLRLELEQNSQSIADEVVILEASSKDALLKTHQRYFMSLEELSGAIPVVAARV